MSRGLPRVLVLTGTSEHPFARLLDVLPGLLERGAAAEVRVQSRHAPPAAPGVVPLGMLAREAVAREIEAADVVVTHGGSASCFEAIRAGHVPIVVPRRASLGEHVDDHQADVAAELERLGLAVVEAEPTVASLAERLRTRAAAGRSPPRTPRAMGTRLRAALSALALARRAGPSSWRVERVDRGAYEAAFRSAAWAHPLQSIAWGSARRLDGWRAQWWRATRPGTDVCVVAQVLRRAAPGLPGYVPYGPVGPATPAAAEGCAALLRALARRSPGGLLWAPSADPMHARAIPRAGGVGVEAPSTTGIVPLGTDDEILARMRGTWRWTLRKALREHRLEVRREPAATLAPDVLERVAGLARERRFRAPVSAAVGSAFAQGAEACGVALLGVAVLADGRTTNRLVSAVTGASAFLLWSAQEEDADPGAGRLALWEALRHARDLGARRFDLSGIDEAGNPGVASFKRGLGPALVAVPGLRWLPPAWLPSALAAALVSARRVRSHAPHG